MATGRTERSLGLLADDGSSHSLTIRVDSPLRGKEGLGIERFAQLAALLNRRLLKSREARRRALQLHSPPPIRLGGGVALLPSRSKGERTSLDRLHLLNRIDGGLSPHEPLLLFAKTVGRGGSGGGGDDRMSRGARLREAYNDACAAVAEDMLTTAMAAAMPSPVELWTLQRRLASQLGLHALLCHALKLRSTQPSSLVFRLDQAAVELSQFDLPLPPFAAAANAAMPFRLTRNLLHFITPLGVDGAFSGAFSAAAECMAQRRKCPLELWLDLLSRPEDPAEDTRAKVCAEMCSSRCV